uniref:sulfate adenylyltransferase n=1 Tax=Pseudictyota dubia TaxID=2749911 RepID=A0A7R9Z839_9STRA|mmetsp:Transcript_26363/g.48999  ORF Transcript_26363/g.48999 Transcript_26363/m.48999 type:complete len:431 (+) Transcript_26363:34-1326(+)
MKLAIAALSLVASASAFAPLSSAGIARSSAVPSAPAFARSSAGVASALEMVKQEPHGGKLVDLMLTDDEAKEAAIAKCTAEVQLTPRQLCDVELIVNGGFSPIDGFMDEETYKNVVEDMSLLDGTIFSIPVIFDTDSEDLQPGMTVLLKDGDRPIATVEFTDKYTPNKPLECLKCYGTASIEHPGALMVATERGKYYMGGKVTGLNTPVRDFPCKSPAEVREGLPADADVVAFQCRNPVHRAHYELFTRALDDPLVGEGGVVLVHPTCGPTQADDIPGDVRYKTYEVLKEETHNPRTFWEYLPYSMHMAGPREAIQHMMIRKNFGCTHFIIGRDMAGSKSSVTGEDFYGAYDAQDFAKEIGPKIGMTPVPSLNLVYTEEEGYVTADEAKERGLHEKKLSGTKFRQMLRGGEDIPEWFAFKSVVKVLRENA